MSSTDLRSILHKSSTIHLAGGASETSATVIPDRGITDAEIPRFDPKTARGSIIGRFRVRHSSRLERLAPGDR
jgi:hypothetical protein